MRKKIFIICMFFLCLFLGILGYKFFTTGNNKNIESEVQFDEYILSINNYDAEAKVTVYSNKNSNTYNLKQYKKENYQKQEIISDNENYGLVIENDGQKITIKNTALDLTSVFENYEEVANNSTGFDSFIDDYKKSDDSELKQEDKYFILKVNIKNPQNIYATSKTLYVNKESSQIEKIEVEDVNNNKTILIEYTRFEKL